MNGQVDGGGRALLVISVKASAQANATTVDAWIDTGFTGELLMPDALIASLGLLQSGTVKAQLGDGSQITMNTYTCRIDWFGQERQIELISGTGQFPLLGVGLLQDHQLAIDYPNKTVALL